MTIKKLCKQAHKIAIEKGFWTDTSKHEVYHKKGIPTSKICRNLSELLMLVVTEISEACEALRNNKRQSTQKYEYRNGKQVKIAKKKWFKDTFEDELADAVIRICDLAESEGVDLEWQIRKKMEYNKKRSTKHNKLF